MVGGRPQMNKQIIYSGRQTSDSGKNNSVPIHCNKIVTDALTILGIGGVSSTRSLLLYIDSIESISELKPFNTKLSN